MTNNTHKTHDELEELLPWYSTAQINPEDANRIAMRLAEDPEFAAHEELVREELNEAVAANEAVGAPSAGFAARFMAEIETEVKPSHQLRAASAGIMDRIGSWISDLAPRQVAWAGAAAAVLILVQAGFITSSMINERSGGTLEVASTGDATKSHNGPVLIIGFQPDADITAISGLLEKSNAKIIEGPMPGGLYRVAIDMPEGTTANADQLIKDLKDQSTVVRMVLPGS